MKWFNELCSKVDLIKSDAEETYRYYNPPQMLRDSETKLRQWVLLRLSSKWEWLPRQKFMKRDNYD